jgi:hypothetical protein
LTFFNISFTAALRTLGHRSQDLVSGLIQKHGATNHAVCAEKLVDGEKTIYSGACGMSAPALWANAQRVAERGQPTGVKSGKSVNQKNIISSGDLSSFNSRFCGGYSELSELAP